MKRKIIKIDEQKCDGCGDCVPNCHEGALQIIDGKARLVSDLFCDGLGACLGHCPQGAITMEEREAEPYDEKKVMERIVPKGRNTVMAHLEHLRDHGETELLAQAAEYIRENNIDMRAPEAEAPQQAEQEKPSAACSGGCPGAAAMDFSQLVDSPSGSNGTGAHPPQSGPAKESNDNMESSGSKSSPKEPSGSASAVGGPSGQESNSQEPLSALGHWPVQLHLLNPMAGFLRKSDLVLAADCVSYAMGNFHHHFLKGKALAIACPKLDSNQETYVEKLTAMIDQAEINTITVVLMEVPCCSGLKQLVHQARERAQRKIPVKKAVVSVRGALISEEWMM